MTTTQKQDDKCGHLATPHGGHVEPKLLLSLTAYDVVGLLDTIYKTIRLDATNRAVRGDAGIPLSEIRVEGVYGNSVDVRLYEQTLADGRKSLYLQFY
jgi:hypothetical protein